MSNGHAARINERLLSYWRGIKPATGLPLESQVDPKTIGDIWDSCFLVHITHDPKAPYEYLMLGSELIDAYGDDLTGKSVSEALFYPHPVPLLRAFEEVEKSGEPLVEESSFTNQAGLLIKYRSCLLPLAKDSGGAATYVLGGMKWKAY